MLESRVKYPQPQEVVQRVPSKKNEELRIGAQEILPFVRLWEKRRP